MKEFNLRGKITAIQFTGKNLSELKENLPNFKFFEMLKNNIVISSDTWKVILYENDWLVFNPANYRPEGLPNDEFRRKYIDSDIMPKFIESFS